MSLMTPKKGSSSAMNHTNSAAAGGQQQEGRAQLVNLRVAQPARDRQQLERHGLNRSASRRDPYFHDWAKPT
jgi:hypothetical protein